jgi:RimJ/RimL family protein N-acetyltransferase
MEWTESSCAVRESPSFVSIIARLKQGCPGEGPFSIRTEAGEEIAVFEALTALHLDDADLLRILTQWRQQYMTMFLTQFTATVERTRNWLAQLVPSDDRVMFLIRDPAGELLGQFGVRCYADGTLELDGGICGNLNSPGGLFYHAERTILRWSFEVLEMRRAVARVFSKNVFAIKLHKRIGLQPVLSEPLKLETTTDGDLHYQPTPPGTRTHVAFELVTLEITREAFLSRSATTSRRE